MHMETDESGEWSTAEGERDPPLFSHFLFYHKLFKLSRLLFSNALILPPSVLLTYHAVLTSLCPTSAPPHPRPPSSWSSLGTPRGRKTANNSDTTKCGGGGTVILLIVLKYIPPFSSEYDEKQSVNDNANECCTEATFIFLSKNIKSYLLLNLSQPSALTTEALSCLFFIHFT